MAGKIKEITKTFPTWKEAMEFAVNYEAENEGYTVVGGAFKRSEDNTHTVAKFKIKEVDDLKENIRRVSSEIRRDLNETKRLLLNKPGIFDKFIR